MKHQILTDADLVRIEDLCAKTTPGPWRSSVEGRDHTSGSNVIFTANQDIEPVGASTEDQDFIASARQDIPLLLATVRALACELKKRGIGWPPVEGAEAEGLDKT